MSNTVKEKDFRANLNFGLKHSCLKTFYINIHNVKTGTVEFDHMLYKFQQESTLLEALKKKASVKCVVSLQIYKTGEKVAVCRIHRDTSPASIAAKLKEALQ